ncbi:phosphotransferase [Streptomyces sp. NPDC059071]|uniref:phosphotransferase n=1 Tax=unclassified Streptomyces TaxID=2593676 RepID=UPI00362699EF
MYSRHGHAHGGSIRFLLGVGLNALGTELDKRGRAKEAVLTFQVAFLVLGSEPDVDYYHSPQKVAEAVKFSRTQLSNLGATTVTDLPLALDEPIWPLSEIFASYDTALEENTLAPAVSQALAPGEVSAPLISAAPVVRAETIEEVDEQEGDPVGDETTDARSARELVDSLADTWSGAERVSMSDQGQELLKYFTKIGGKHGAFGRRLGKILQDDLKRAAQLFPDGMPTRRHDLHALARKMRNLAGRRESQERPPLPEEVRLRWLVSAVTNHLMWNVEDGLLTNRPHVLHDLMRYLGSIISSDMRFQDSARDLILDCVEIQVRVTTEIPSVFLDKYFRLRPYTLASVGTYLMLAGPNPPLPQDSDHDPRVWHRVDGTPVRAQRMDWPEILLRQWRDDEHRKGACFALASAAGWNETRAQWLLHTLFARSTHPDRDTDRDLWLRDVSELMTSAGKVRVATNPWGYEKSGTDRGSAITSDDAGRLRVPSTVLQAAVAQGLSPGEVITVHGNLFAGRRMPTYLLTNRYGPLSVLKIDQRDKVLREVHNFRRFAKRLHQNNRPSECESHAMEMYLGDNSEPLRAIETAYAFEEGESPSTLSDWIRTADPKDATAIVEKLLLTTMKPWIAHSRRDRIDLRAEYPVFRPAPALNKQSPARWAAIELNAIISKRVHEELQTTFTADDPALGPWAGSAPGLTAALERFPAGVEPVNPFWFAAELAEIGSGAFSDILDSFDIGLLDFDTTLTLSHGDLHLDNVLCTLGGDQPKPVLIDFESAHDGHVCKDLARLEASLLCQVFEWDGDAASRVAGWVAEVLVRPQPPSTAPLQSATPPDLLPAVDGDRSLGADERLVLAVSRRIREIAIGCGQGHWPIKADEYHLALAGALLPMVRYSTMSLMQRRFALTLSTLITSALRHRWTTVVTEGAQG